MDTHCATDCMHLYVTLSPEAKVHEQNSTETLESTVKWHDPSWQLSNASVPVFASATQRLSSTCENYQNSGALTSPVPLKTHRAFATGGEMADVSDCTEPFGPRPSSCWARDGFPHACELCTARPGVQALPESLRFNQLSGLFLCIMFAVESL